MTTATSEPSIDPPPVVVAMGDAEDELETHFFSTPPPELHEAAFAPTLPHEPELDIERSRHTVAPVRRARFVRIVKMSVVACSLLCVTAALRVALTKGRSEVHAAARSAPIAALPPPPDTASVPVVTAPEAPAEPAADPRWSDSKSATKAAIAALEMHRVAEAIAASTSATLLDANDGEAWLVLGAAYQDSGRMSDALGAYRTCTVQGRVDPRGECRAMLRSLGGR